MPVPFSQTTRALQADHGRFSRLTLGLAIFLLFLWSYWFFAASIHHYVRSEKIELSQAEQPTWKIPQGGKRAIAYNNYTLRAYFSPADLQQIKPGQQARLLLLSPDTLPRRPLTTRVEQLEPLSGAVYVRLEIPAKPSGLLAGATLESMEIAVSQQTPAAFLFHTARRAARR